MLRSAGGECSQNGSVLLPKTTRLRIVHAEIFLQTVKHKAQTRCHTQEEACCVVFRWIISSTYSIHSIFRLEDDANDGGWGLAARRASNRNQWHPDRICLTYNMIHYSVAYCYSSYAIAGGQAPLLLRADTRFRPAGGTMDLLNSSSVTASSCSES